MRFLERLGMAASSGDAVSPAEAKQLQHDGALIVDVREPDEWMAGHVSGAQHIPLGTLASRLAELPPDRPIIFMCQSGNRSQGAVRAARAAGFPQARNLTGGIGAWRHAGLPVVRGR